MNVLKIRFWLGRLRRGKKWWRCEAHSKGGGDLFSHDPGRSTQNWNPEQTGADEQKDSQGHSYLRSLETDRAGIPSPRSKKSTIRVEAH